MGSNETLKLLHSKVKTRQKDNTQNERKYLQTNQQTMD